MKYLFVCSRLDTMLGKRRRLLRRLINDGADVYLISMEYHGNSVSELREMGVRFHLTKAKRNKISFLSDLKYLFELYDYFNKVKPDVIIAYTIKPNLYSGLITRIQGLDVMFFPIVTGLGFAFQEGNILRLVLKRFVTVLYKISFKNVQKVILQNNDNRRYFSELNIAPMSKMLVIAGDGVELPGIDTKQFNDPKRVVCVARLLGEKGLRELHLATLEVKKNFPDFSVELYGPQETSPDAILDSELAQWKDMGTLKWEGYCDSVDNLLSEADAFILPSYHEGMCTAVSEAIAFGLPVIGTDISGIREMVDGNGFLVKRKDVGSIVIALNSLLSQNDDAWSDMSKRSIQIAKTRFDRKLLMNQIYDVVTLNG